MIAQLHVIVWRRCGGAGQPEWRLREGLNDLVADLAGVCLEDAALIEHHSLKAGCIKVRELFVVGDGDAGLHLGLCARKSAINAKLAAFAHGLMRDRKRRKDKNVAASVLTDLRSPFKLHGGFPHAAISPDAELANTASHGHDVALKRKKCSSKMIRVKS